MERASDFEFDGNISWCEIYLKDKFKGKKFSWKSMNFFPNLQINIFSSDAADSSRLHRPQSRNSIPSLLQQVLRRGDVGNNPSVDLEDVQIFVETIPYLNQQTQTLNQPAFQGLQIEELNQNTELIIYTPLESRTSGSAAEICGICRNNFQSMEICRKLLACQHFFHQRCVDSWLHRNNTCPMCRRSVVGSSTQTPSS